MNTIDSHHKLEEEIFSYRETKDKVFIYWHGRQVTILKGKRARKFLAKIEGLEHQEAQLTMAKITGNFKRGNERQGAR
jgi:phenylalanine-4-hydroxylase